MSKMRWLERRQDFVAAVLFIALAAILIWVAIPLGVQEPKKVKFVALSPSYYPRLVGYCLMGFGILLLVRQWFGANPRQETPDSEDAGYRPGALKILGLVALILLMYYWFLSSLGLVLISTLVLVAMQIIAGERSAVIIGLISVIAPMLLYLFFTKVANIPIPGGILEPLLLRL